MEKKRKNPWQGLKSYSEGKVLYGRDKEIVELSQKILYNTQTIIYGRSGIGKSSLLKAGVFPVLRKHNLFPVYIRLSHSEKDDYGYANQVFDAVEKSLSELRVENLDSEAGYDVVSGYKEETVPVVNEHEEGLWEYFHRHRFFYKPVGEEEPVQITPVLVFDQFEELFTLQDDRAKMLSLFKELEFLLNDVCPDELLQQGKQEGSAAEGSVKSGSLIKTAVSFKVRENRYLKGNNFHLVMSVREDFLSHLERNSTNIPSLKHNRYCLLPLSEDRAAEVIMKPVPGLVSLQVAKEIISKVTGVPATGFEIDDNPELEVDSAILSLFLSELYVKKGADEAAITLGMVEKFGSNIISDFYQETMERISKPSVEYLERRLVTKEGRRDAIYWEQALRHNVTQKELDFLLGQRLLHRYSWRDGIRVEFSHDILCPIISKRRKERESEAERAKARRTKRILMLSLALSLLCVGGLVYWYIYSEKKYQKEYVDECVEIYASLVRRYTWLEGLKPLTKEEASHYTKTYWFYKRGTKAKHPYKMEIRDGYGNLQPVDEFSNSISQEDEPLPEVSDDYKKLTTSIASIVFVSDADDKYCVLEKLYDAEGNAKCYISKLVDEKEQSFMYTFTDVKGYPIIYKGGSPLYQRSTFQEDGYEALSEAYNQQGYPQEIEERIFKFEHSYFPNGTGSEMKYLFVDASPVNHPELGLAGHKILETTADGVFPTMYVYFDKNRYVCKGKIGYSVSKIEYDKYDRPIKQSYYDVAGNVHVDSLLSKLKQNENVLLKVTNDSGAHEILFGYNDNGMQTDIFLKGISGELVYRAAIEYDDEGRMTSRRYFFGNDVESVETYMYIDGEMYINESYQLDANCDTVWTTQRYDDLTLIEKEGYIVRKVKLNADNLPIEIAYFDKNDTTECFYGYHMMRRDITNGDGFKEIVTTYYDIDDRAVNVYMDFDIEGYKSVLRLDSMNAWVSESYYKLDTANRDSLVTYVEFKYTDTNFKDIVGVRKDKEGPIQKLIFPDTYVGDKTPLENTIQPVAEYYVDSLGNRIEVNGYSLELFDSQGMSKRYNKDNEELEEINIMTYKVQNGADARFGIGDFVIGIDDEFIEYYKYTDSFVLISYISYIDMSVGHKLTMYDIVANRSYEVFLEPYDTVYDYLRVIDFKLFEHHIKGVIPRFKEKSSSHSY